VIFRPISPFYRTLLAIGLALALPTLLVVALNISFGLQQQQTDIESAAMARAQQVSALNDARVQSDLSAMEVLASSRSFESRDWEAFRTLTEQVLALNPGWKTVTVTDLTAQQEVFDLTEPIGAAEVRATQPFVNDSTLNFGNGAGGVTNAGRLCPCVYLNELVTTDDGARLLMTVILDPVVFQQILAPRTPEGASAATVDRQGAFVARVPAFDERVGTPATVFVREAIARGTSGIYEGRTYEGVESYTAFFTSPVTGWSTHIALRASLLDGPAAWSNWVLILGALGAMGVAAAGIAFALYSLAERRREEERMRQAQKLEALGRLTGGVAHDFNNLLTVIIGGLGMLLPKLDDPRSKRWAENALDAAQRGAALTRQLLAFSRGQKLEVRPVNMVELLDSMRELLRQSVGPDIVVELDIDPVHYWVRSDDNQLELAILNLAINARDAMNDGGTLTITVAESAMPACVDVIVADTGAGMTKDVLERAMEPFFTTKGEGAGTGLGLAQVFGAIRQSGGTVNIDSAPGAGTRVKLTLPASDPTETEAPAKDTARISRSAAARRRVIVVDDEPGVREIMAETLRSAGFAVTEAPDGPTALRLLESDGAELLLTDFAMSGMNGAELVRLAREQATSLKVLIVSGHADIQAVDAARADAPLLRKPFTAEDLLAAVGVALVD
jgi:signal transduction histidine kinase/CheY-like chemotaxis protein